VFVPLYFAAKRERHKHSLYVQFLEKGQEIPPELMPRSSTRKSSREREVTRGVWLVSLGLGIGLVLYIATSDWRMAAWSLILLFLGAASFINAALLYPPDQSGRQRDDAD
jgi:type VI protein secretion system component VasF